MIVADIPTTENYKIVMTTDDEGTDLYGIQNIDTEVIEYKDVILSRTYFALRNFQENHDRMVADIRGESLIEVPPPGTQAPTLVQ